MLEGWKPGPFMKYQGGSDLVWALPSVPFGLVTLPTRAGDSATSGREGPEAAINLSKDIVWIKEGVFRQRSWCFGVEGDNPDMTWGRGGGGVNLPHIP